MAGREGGEGKGREEERRANENERGEERREGTQADPLVSEICSPMFGLGKWKLLWRVRRINPSFLIPGGDVGERGKGGDGCVYRGKGGWRVMEGLDTGGPHPDTRRKKKRKKKISTRNV